jgi:hypothetical protein
MYKGDEGLNPSFESSFVDEAGDGGDDKFSILHFAQFKYLK